MGVLALLSPGELGEARFSIVVLVGVGRSLSLRGISVLVFFDDSVDNLLCTPSLQALDLALQSFDFALCFLLRCLKFVDSSTEQVVDDFQLVHARAKRIVLRHYSVEGLRCLEVVRSRRGEGVGGHGDVVEEVLRRDVRVLVLRWSVAAAERGAG